MAVPQKTRRERQKFVADGARGGARLGLRQRIEMADGLRPHARRLHERDIGAGGEWHEIADSVEGIVFAQAGGDGRFGPRRHPHTLRLRQTQSFEPGELGVVGREGPSHQVAPAWRQIVGDVQLPSGRQVGRVHRDVPRARLLAVGHRRNLKQFVGKPHRDVVYGDGETARETTDGGVAVVDELQDAVDGLVGMGHVDPFQDLRQTLVAARIAGEYGSEQFRRDLRESGSGRGRDKGKRGDLHADVIKQAQSPP